MITITKKVSPKYPPEEYLEILSPDLPQNILFYDIETTGLSPDRDEVYLIGAAVQKDGGYEYIGFFSESPEDEPAVLSAFANLCKECSCMVMYNGTTFDHPFLTKRYNLYGLPDPLRKKELDLYKAYRPLKPLLGLKSMRQSTLEACTGIERKYPNGKAGITLYKAYQKDKDPIKQKILVGHNIEDIEGMLHITSFASYLQYQEARFRSTNAAPQNEKILFQIETDLPIPKPFTFENPHIKTEGETHKAKVWIPTNADKLKQYYPDYKNYDYIPAEDTAMTRSVSRFLDKSLRKAATPETCYTWFTPDNSFFNNPELQTRYLRQSLPIMLKLK